MVNRALAGLAEFILRWRWLVLANCVAATMVAAQYGAGVADRLSPGGYGIAGSDSALGAETLALHFDSQPPNLVVLAGTQDGSPVDDEEIRAAGLELTDLLRDLPVVVDVDSYWELGTPALRDRNGSAALITGRIVGDDNQLFERVEIVRSALADHDGPLDVAVGGQAAAGVELVEESEADLLRAELLAIPITTVVMVFVFRSLIAALLPLVVAAVAVLGTSAALTGLSEFTSVSIFALNITTALGLGIGVDFALFTISRWREERAAGASPDDAIRTTLTTVGRSILFSGLTTAATLAAFLVFDYSLFRSLAYGGFAVVILATAGGLIALPATLAVLGDRVDRFAVRRHSSETKDAGAWSALARRVMSHPWPVMTMAVAVLLLAGSPFLRAEFGSSDDRSLPQDSSSRAVADALRTGFDGLPFGALALVAPTTRLAADGETADEVIATYAASISSVDGVARVESPVGVFAQGRKVAEVAAPSRYLGDPGLWMAVVPSVEPVSAEAETMVRTVRALPAPDRFYLTGESAQQVDTKAEIAQKLPWVAAWVIVVVGGLLFLAFRSVLIPIKAIVLNLLSLTAAFGALVWIFQDGRFTGMLRFTPTGMIDAQMPVIVLCIAFGLSMDYEVFLLSRIQEEWLATGRSDRSIAVGLQRTGSSITAAALLMTIVFLSFATGQVTLIQMIGIGLAVAIVADATLVRSLLVPALMTLAGRWNWWAPKFGRQGGRDRSRQLRGGPGSGRRRGRSWSLRPDG